MTPTWFFMLLEISIVACGVVSGVFLTFSDFVMRSLNGARSSAGVEVMQIVNREVWKTVFMTLLLGMSALSPFLMAYAFETIAGPAALLIVAGGAIYVAGVFAVSLVFNVPMNKRLDTMNFANADAASYWTETYFPRWTFWNYVRSISSAAAASCFLIASASLAGGVPAA